MSKKISVELDRKELNSLIIAIHDGLSNPHQTMEQRKHKEKLFWKFKALKEDLKDMK